MKDGASLGVLLLFFLLFTLFTPPLVTDWRFFSANTFYLHVITLINGKPTAMGPIMLTQTHTISPSLSLSLSNTHTHTHTHTQRFSLLYTPNHTLVYSLKILLTFLTECDSLHINWNILSRMSFLIQSLGEDSLGMYYRRITRLITWLTSTNIWCVIL